MFIRGESFSLLRRLAHCYWQIFCLLVSFALFPDIDIDVRAVALVGGSPQISLEVPANNKNNE